MLVPVAAMGHVTVTVVDVVDVVTMRDRDVSTLRPVLVGMSVVRHMVADLTFVGVSVVAAMNVTVVDVVDVVFMLEGHMATARTVVMRVIGMSLVRGHGRSDGRFRCRTTSECPGSAANPPSW